MPVRNTVKISLYSAQNVEKIVIQVASSFSLSLSAVKELFRLCKREKMSINTLRTAATKVSSTSFSASSRAMGMGATVTRASVAAPVSSPNLQKRTFLPFGLPIILQYLGATVNIKLRVRYLVP